jgi:hypothetical protein
MMKIHIDFFKATGKYYTSEEMLLESWPLGVRQLGFETCLVKMLTTEVEGKTRVRYAGMTAVCADWWGVPVLAKVPGYDAEENRKKLFEAADTARSEGSEGLPSALLGALVQPTTRPMDMDCPKCGAKRMEWTTSLMWGPYSGTVECKGCEYKDTFMNFMARSIIKVQPMPPGAEPIFTGSAPGEHVPPLDTREDMDFDERCDHCIHTYGQHNVDGKGCSRCEEGSAPQPCTGFKKRPEVTERDKEWVKALNGEFKIGGAILTEDEQWVKEKDTYPERWARILKLAVTPRDIKLHQHQPPLKVTIGPSCFGACQNCEGGDHDRCSMKQCHCSKGAAKKRKCNRHEDCEAADAKAKAKYDAASQKEKIDLHQRAEHCDDETCEDCFGT